MVGLLARSSFSNTSAVVAVIKTDVGTTSSSWVGTEATVDIVIIFIVSAYVKTTNSHSTDTLTTGTVAIQNERSGRRKADCSTGPSIGTATVVDFGVAIVDSIRQSARERVCISVVFVVPEHAS